MRLCWRNQCGMVLKLPCPCWLLQTRVPAGLLFFYKIGMTVAGTPSPFQTSIHALIQRRSVASHNEGSWECDPGWHSVHQHWNTALRSMEDWCVHPIIALAPKHLSSELGSISFYWVFIGLGLCPWCLNCWSASPHSISLHFSKSPQHFWHVVGFLPLFPTWHKYLLMDLW